MPVNNNYSGNSSHECQVNFLLSLLIASWQPNKTGDLSTAGTTACTIIFRKNHIFVANVGDSTAVMGIRNPHFGQPGEPPVIARVISRDHKPEDPSEQEHIRKLGEFVLYFIFLIA